MVIFNLFFLKKSFFFCNFSNWVTTPPPQSMSGATFLQKVFDHISLEERPELWQVDYSKYTQNTQINAKLVTFCLADTNGTATHRTKMTL